MPEDQPPTYEPKTLSVDEQASSPPDSPAKRPAELTAHPQAAELNGRSPAAELNGHYTAELP